MKKSLILSLVLLSITCLELDAQKYTRIGIMGYEQPEIPATPEGVSQDARWVIPPVFLESERRFLKYFTLGSEIQFSRYGVDTEIYGTEHTFRATNIGLELQGKVSIPIVEMFEAYGQYGIGYMHSFISNKSHIEGHDLDQSFGIGYISNTLSVGGSVIFGESIGLFIEAGVMKTRSVKTINEIYDDSIDGSDFNNPRVDLGPMGEDHSEGSAGFVKLGVVFQINR